MVQCKKENYARETDENAFFSAECKITFNYYSFLLEEVRKKNYY